MVKRDNVVKFINQLEAYKTACKNFHWSAKNLSQHKLCDDISDTLSEYQDTFAEIEQSIGGKFKLNILKAPAYKEDNLRAFVTDVIESTDAFLKELGDGGDTYVGMKSEVESFLGEMQKYLYLVDFTLKEEIKRNIAEAMHKNVPSEDGKFDAFMGQHPKTVKGRINQIYKRVAKYGIDKRKYHDDAWQAIDDYHKAISSFGCDVDIHPENGGYTDYAEDGMPRSKEYKVSITYEDGMTIGGYIKCMAAGTVEDPFSSYDTCIILWPKKTNVIEGKKDDKKITVTEGMLRTMVNETLRRFIEKNVING